jgi:divalent metal cation (Fe/Co/Zn/Cd) transporter
MVAVVPTEVTPVVAILIMLPYFVATIWTIFYTHNKTKKMKAITVRAMAVAAKTS